MSDLPETAGFVAPEPAELAPLFPGYEIQGLIATGGMGAVYLAVQKSLDREVALKILPMEFSSDAAFCAGFEAEAKAMGRLNHPNLIGVYDFGEANGMLYIIMEYVPGESLYHAAYGTRIDPGEVIRLVTAICNGLAHAHANGIIHRDIKPSNILLDINAQPKIGDFGLARPIERKIEEGEEIFGTPHYTAPEVVNSPQSVDYRADIFSVGVLLHELLTAKLPADDPRPPSLIARCDLRFDAIVRRATQPLPAARYSSAAEITKELQAIAASTVRTGPHAPGGPTARGAAVPRRPGSRPVVSVRKKSSNSALILFLLLAAVAGVAAMYYYKDALTTIALPPVVPQAKILEPRDPTSDNQVENLLPADRSSPPAEELPSPAEASPPEEAPPTAVSTEPKYDVQALYDRARIIMQDRAQPAIRTYESNLKANFADFERSLLRQPRRVTQRVDTPLEAIIAEWRAEGEKVPARLGRRLAAIPEIEASHRAHYQRQIGIEDTFNEALIQLSATYILGLQKQIERLESEDDPVAITLIGDEIKRTRNDRGYFPKLILGSRD
ncbi:MAG: protein kinase [Akkermansiaceae bacterium]